MEGFGASSWVLQDWGEKVPEYDMEFGNRTEQKKTWSQMSRNVKSSYQKEEEVGTKRFEERNHEAEGMGLLQWATQVGRISECTK